MSIAYAHYFNAERAHQSLDGDAPEHREPQHGTGRVIAVPYLGGLHHSYRRAA